jgi:hypothetical protein
MSFSGMGDLFADLKGIAAVAQASGTPGGIAGWVQQQLASLQRLPGESLTLQRQSARVRLVVEGAGSEPNAISLLDRADSDLAQVNALLPDVQQRVSQVTLQLAPVWPQLTAGTMDAPTAAALLGSSPDIADSFDALTGLFALRDDAKQVLASIAANPALSSSTRVKVSQALTGGDYSGVVKVGLILAGVYVVARTLAKRGR